MKKKLLGVLLSAAIFTTVLAGCGSKDTGSTNAAEGTGNEAGEVISQNADQEASKGENTAQTGAITFWYMGDSTSGIQPIIDEFTKETGIAVNVQSIPWQNLSEKLLTAIASQSGPDVMQTAVSRTAELVTADAIIDMTEYVNTIEGFGLDRFYDASYESLKMNDKYYGVPWIVDVYLMIYRTDLFEEAGYTEFPATQQEFFEACKAIKEKTGITPFTIGAADNYNELFCYPYQSGSEIVTEDRVAVFNQPEYIDAMEYLNSFYEAGLANRVMDGVSSYVKLTNGEIAACFGGTWEVGQLAAVEEMEGKWAVAVWPKGSATNDSVYAGSNLVIPAWTTNEEAAVQLIEFLTRTENQLKYRELAATLPAGREAWEDERLANDPVFSVFGKQIENAKAFPKVPEIEEIGIEAVSAYERISVGEEDIQTVCDELNTFAQGVLDN